MSMRQIFTFAGTTIGAVLAGGMIAATPAMAEGPNPAVTTPEPGSTWTSPQAGSTWTLPQAGSTWTAPQAGSTWTNPAQLGSAQPNAGHLLVDDGRNLTRVTTQGTEAKTLVAGKAAQRKYGSYSPDATRIAFTDVARSGGFGAQVWTMKIDGTDRRQLTKLDNQAYGPKFSPNGRSIAFQVVSGGTASVWTVGADGRNPRQVTKADGGYYGRPSWDPTGASFVTARADVGERSGEPFNWEIVNVKADGSAQKRLTATAGDKNTPVYSPNGSTIVFSNITPQGVRAGAQYDLWSIKADGSAARQLTATKNAAEQDAVFSPTGSQLVFARWANGTSAPKVWKSAADGSAAATTAAIGYPTSWS